MKILSTLMRGAAAEAEDAVFEVNAIRILEQQLRDAAIALEHAKRELACAMAHRASEARAAEALDARIAELETSAVAALVGSRDDLAEEAATVIAATEDERADRCKAVERLDVEILRLRRLADDGHRRLADLRRGLEMARAQEALRRAGANGRRALATGTGALREAEATLKRIRESHVKAEDLAAAAESLDDAVAGKDLDQRLAEAGFRPGLRTKPSDVLARLKARNAAERPSTAGPAKPDEATA
ncbi:MAG: PspA/IM30 family protein [Hyphomicrobiaceae bacterium]|nr:PspA/IM30 family protein [Hyphomicrobiaceae bacterium]